MGRPSYRAAWMHLTSGVRHMDTQHPPIIAVQPVIAPTIGEQNLPLRRVEPVKLGPYRALILIPERHKSK